jgi:hypothetical protein
VLEISVVFTNGRSRDRSVSVVSDYGLDGQATEVRSPAETRIFPVASMSRPALWPTQLPVHRVSRVHSSGLKRGQGVTLITHPHLVPRSMSRSYTSSPAKLLRGV